jgi:hypothetical protein
MKKKGLSVFEARCVSSTCLLGATSPFAMSGVRQNKNKKRNKKKTFSIY